MMAPAPLIVITGPPGAGKTTVAPRVAEAFERSVCLESDWFWTTIARGFVPPWLPEADAQNRAVLRSFVASGAVLAAEGFVVVLEGIIGPWHLPVVLPEIRRLRVEPHYFVLRPASDESFRRAVERGGEVPRFAGQSPLTAAGPVRHMGERFSDLGDHERFVIDNTGLDPELAATTIVERVRAGVHRL